MDCVPDMRPKWAKRPCLRGSHTMAAPGVDPVGLAVNEDQPPPKIFLFIPTKIFADCLRHFLSQYDHLTRQMLVFWKLTPATARILVFKVPDITGIYNRPAPLLEALI